MTTGVRRWRCNWPSDHTIVRSRGRRRTPRPACCGFVVQCQFRSLSRRASRIILGHVDPHHMLRKRRKCHCSGRPHASVDRTRTLPRNVTREIFSSSLMTFAPISFLDPPAPPITFLHQCTRSDVSRFGNFCFCCQVRTSPVICVFQS